MVLGGLEPARVWAHFEALSAIPRCSYAEAAARAHIEAQAARWGLSTARDAVGNLVVRKPASPGREDHPVVVLQSHLDMVCEQDLGGTHDFSCDSIDLATDGTWVRAEGTTLGADNGVGVALALAILEDRSLTHGPLEALFTVDEETEMSGAAHLDPSLVTGRLILNLDGEGDGQFLVGAAGGITCNVRVPMGFAPTDAEGGWTVWFQGLRGGHSGADIHLQRGNALALAARFAAGFLASEPPGSWQLALLEGGDKDNAIPREALVVLAGSPPDRLQAAAGAFAAELRAELGPAGEQLTLIVASDPRPEVVLTPTSQAFLLDLLVSLPDGVEAFSSAVPGLVETSSNLGRVRLEDGYAHVVVSTRSSQPTAVEALSRRVEAMSRLAGGTVTRSGIYPAWPPKAGGCLVQVAPPLWHAVTGQAPEVLLIHAGLECGFWAEKFPDADILSFGPRIEDAHTPRERVEVASVDRVHRFLITLLETL